MTLRKTQSICKAGGSLICFLTLVILFIDNSIASDMNEKVAQVRIGSSNLEEVIKIFNEPTKYVWDKETFTRDNLPSTYIAVFPDDFHVVSTFAQRRGKELGGGKVILNDKGERFPQD